MNTCAMCVYCAGHDDLRLFRCYVDPGHAGVEVEPDRPVCRWFKTSPIGKSDRQHYTETIYKALCCTGLPAQNPPPTLDWLVETAAEVLEQTGEAMVVLREVSDDDPCTVDVMARRVVEMLGVEQAEARDLAERAERQLRQAEERLPMQRTGAAVLFGALKHVIPDPPVERPSLADLAHTAADWIVEQKPTSGSDRQRWAEGRAWILDGLQSEIKGVHMMPVCDGRPDPDPCTDCDTLPRRGYHACRGCAHMVQRLNSGEWDVGPVRKEDKS